VLGNSTQLRQVVINLIMNAAEALEDQQGFITVTTERAFSDSPMAVPKMATLPAGEHVRLTVSDTGSGMSPETRARIFDQFFTTKSSGRGLGLAAVHGIVRSHGGAITVVSEPGAGSTFEVLIPCISRGDNSNIAIRSASKNGRGVDLKDHSFS
jgi:signal transduction histidine kinase